MAVTTVANNSVLNILKATPGVLDLYMTHDNQWACMMGAEGEMPIAVLNELTNRQGDTVRSFIFDKLNQAPIEGDNTLEGFEEALGPNADSVNINQARNAVLLDGAMTMQRSEVDLAKLSKNLLGGWIRDFVSVLITYTASGARGVRTAPILGTGFTGWGTNGLQAPDASSIIYGATATSAATLTPGDKFSTDVIYRASALMENLYNAGRPRRPSMLINGTYYFPWVISPAQKRDLQRDPLFVTAQQQARERGDKNPMFTGYVGCFDQFVFFVNPFAVQFNTYGASGTMLADRSVILGGDAIMFASASAPVGGGFQDPDALGETGVVMPGDNLQDPRQKMVGGRDTGEGMGAVQGDVAKTSLILKRFDYANKLGLAVAIMLGAKKTRVGSTNNIDHGMITVDTAISAA